MNITLYKYSNRSLIANKMEDRELITLFFGNITPYGEFNSQRVSFRLSDLYEANYCKYEFNGKEYYGYVNVDVDSKGLYVYNVVVDALSSCWYNDCFDTNILIERMTFGQSQNKDSEIIWKDRYSKRVIPITGKSRNVYILIQAIWGGFDKIPAGSVNYSTIKTYFIPEDLGNGEQNDHIIYSPGIITYLLTYEQWEVFLKYFYNLSDAQQGKVAQSIFKIAAVDGDVIGNQVDFPGVSTFPVAVNSGAGTLFRPSLLFFQEEGKVFTIPVSESGYTIDDVPQVYFSFPSFYLHILDGEQVNYIDKDSNSYQANSIGLNSYEESLIQFFFPNSVSTLIKLRDLPNHILKLENNYRISTIGYRSYFDPGSFITTYYPRFNGELLLDFPTQSEISTQFPLPVDSSITNWHQIGASALATIGTTVATIVTGGLTAPAIIAATTGLGATTASAISQETNGGFVVKGVSGGNLEWVSQQGIFCYLYTQLPEVEDIDAFDEEFGSPHEQMGNIIGLPFPPIAGDKMYIRTRNANLASKGMPSQLIQEAQRISNTGFYIVRPSI